MSKQLKFLCATALCAAISMPAAAQDTPDINSVVASVNSQDITLGEMIAVRDALPDQYKSLPADVLFNGILDQLIQQTALAQSIGDAVPKRIELVLVNERRTLLAADVIDHVLTENAPTEDDVQSAYNEKYGNFEGAPEFNASHILVETEEEANSIREALNAGSDFSEMAKAKSTGPSGPSGGALGWFGLGQMVQPFETAVTSMAVGEISQPVETQFGWHLIILNDKRHQAAPSLEDVRAELQTELQNKVVDAYVTELTLKSEVDRSGAEGVDPSVISRSDLLDVE
ncbi:peptidylprolyl isomerase [Shimia abyssi]|uniref:Parvulin-like PPIase n=1 Tax=Shimia abyssi TaxID=1662395 RepID=A0A2P8F8F3_9RHOB|nr:peptidylprolyl isomerase [Shimia abyssi]PSL18006.1 peptidyl-prolyl cis-trans isomerase C [Shimia abyssi]